MKTLRILALRFMAIVALAVSFTSCDGVIYDDSDCESSYNMVRFTYDHNMKFADAFDAEVSRVSLMAFNATTGRLVQRIDMPSDMLTDDNELPLDIEPGQYDILVWGGEYDSHFDITAGENGTSAAEEFHCYLHRDEALRVTEELPRLFHGMVRVDLPFASKKDPNRFTVNLKKNTNTIRVVLQHLSGQPVVADDFEFTVTDANGWLNHDNSLREDDLLTYHPWYTHSGSVDINTDPSDAPGSRYDGPRPASRASLSASLVEFTTSRLHTQNKPTLTVRRKSDGTTVFSIPVNDYALLVKGFGNSSMSDQEYLDRQDEYNMTFFLDERGHWLSSMIIINNWRIVRHETNLE